VINESNKIDVFLAYHNDLPQEKFWLFNIQEVNLIEMHTIKSVSAAPCENSIIIW